MAQLSISFDQVPSTSNGGGKQVSNFSDVKVALRETGITANVISALADGGFFITEEDEFDLHPIVIDYAAAHGVKINLTLADAMECAAYESALAPFYEVLEGAVERLRTAMENAKDSNDRTGFYSVEDYLDDVYYWYGINSTIAHERPLGYSEFMKACKGFCTIYNYAR